MKGFFSKGDQNRKKTANLVTFTEETFNGELHFLCSVNVFFSQIEQEIPSVDARIIPNISDIERVIEKRQPVINQTQSTGLTEDFKEGIINCCFDH